MRYTTDGELIDFIDILERLDEGWAPSRGSGGGAVTASRRKERAAQSVEGGDGAEPVRVTGIDHLSEILPVTRAKPALLRLEVMECNFYVMDWNGM